jgi:tetratricopeptide (TPR) repeat protein
MALDSLGNALRLADRVEEAITTLQEAVDIFGEIKNRHGEGMALNSLGNALRQAKRIEQAITTLREAIAIFRETIIYQELVAAKAA